MSEPGERTARYEPGVGSRTSAGGLSGVSADDRDTATYPPVAAPSGADVHEDGDRAAHLETPDESTGPQSDPADDAVDDTSEFVRPAPVEVDTRRARFGATVSQRLGGSAHATGIWIGAVLAIAGLGAIGYTWREIAALTNVAEQMPYLVSGGISGLVLVIAGATVADVAVRRRDSQERAAQLAQMTQALAEVRTLLEAEHPHREDE